MKLLHNKNMREFLLFLILITSVAYGAHTPKFGEYRYTKYLGIQQQIRTQQMADARRQRLYNQNPLRNVRYSNYPGQYPNIERRYYGNTRVNRYSPAYYQMRYR